MLFWRVFPVNFEQISHIAPLILKFTLKKINAGWAVPNTKNDKMKLPNDKEIISDFQFWKGGLVLGYSCS